MKDCIKHTNKHTRQLVRFANSIETRKSCLMQQFLGVATVCGSKQTVFTCPHSQTSTVLTVNPQFELKIKKGNFVNLSIYKSFLFWNTVFTVSVTSNIIILFFNFGKVTRPFGFHSNKGGEKNIKSQVTQTRNTTAGSDDNCKKEEQSIYFKMKINN